MQENPLYQEQQEVKYYVQSIFLIYFPSLPSKKGNIIVRGKIKKNSHIIASRNLKK